MRLNTLLNAVLAPALVSAAAASTRHFYTSSPQGEYAPRTGFAGSPIPIGYMNTGGTAGTVPLWRCRNTGYDTWLLTTRADCEGAPGFVREGAVGAIQTSQVAGTAALDRYYNTQADHMLVKADEYPGGAAYRCDVGYYTREGTLGFIYPYGAAQPPGTIPLYLFRKGNNNARSENCPLNDPLPGPV